jgi:hypothetical protein
LRPDDDGIDKNNGEILLKRILELDRNWSYNLRVVEKPSLLRNFAMFFAHFGDSWFWGLAMVILWLAALLRAWPPLVSIVLMAMGVHYLPDILTGTVVGIFGAVVGYHASLAIFAWLSQKMTPFGGFGLW